MRYCGAPQSATPVLKVEGGGGHSPVSKVATDCKAGVKFDLVGHSDRTAPKDRTFNSYSKHGMTTDSLYWGLSSYAKSS